MKPVRPANGRSKRRMNMLKGIPEIITPELLHVLAEMGHTD